MSNQLIQAEIAKLGASACISLYILDATNIIGGEILRFYSGTDRHSQPIVFQGNTYTPLPVEVTGYEFRSSGPPPRPSVRFSNYNNAFSALVLAFDDLIGAKLTRLRTYEKYLDGRPGADPTAVFPPDIFKIERKVTENNEVLEFELASDLDLDNVQLPKRQVFSTVCPWKYRGPECSFAGDYPVADELNVLFPTSGLTNRGLYVLSNTYNEDDYVYILSNGIRQYYLCFEDNGVGITGELTAPPNSLYWKACRCSKNLSGCTARFGATAPLPFGGFPGTQRFTF